MKKNFRKGLNVSLVTTPCLPNSLSASELSTLSSLLNRRNERVHDLITELRKLEEDEIDEKVQERLDEKLINLNVIKVEDGNLNYGAEHYLETRINQCKRFIYNNHMGIEGLFDGLKRVIRNYFNAYFRNIEAVNDELINLTSEIKLSKFDIVKISLSREVYEVLNINGRIDNSLEKTIDILFGSLKALSEGYVKSVREQIINIDRTLAKLPEEDKDLENPIRNKIFIDGFKDIVKRPRFNQCNIRYRPKDGDVLEKGVSYLRSIYMPGNYFFLDTSKDSKYGKVETMADVYEELVEFNRCESLTLKQDTSYFDDYVEKEIKIDKKLFINALTNLQKCYLITKNLQDVYDELLRPELYSKTTSNKQLNLITEEEIKERLLSVEKDTGDRGFGFSSKVEKVYHIYHDKAYKDFYDTSVMVFKYIKQLLPAMTGLCKDVLEKVGESNEQQN